MEATRRAHDAEKRRGATDEQLFEAASRYPLNPDPRFIKHPANWLREGHWKDEPPIITLPAKGSPFGFQADKLSKTAWLHERLRARARHTIDEQGRELAR